MKDEEDIRNLKHIRVGPMDQGRMCDKIANAAMEVVDGNVLPPRWYWKSREDFKSRFPSPIMWSKTQSFRLLIVDGLHSLRVWTDSPDSCLVDIADHLVPEFKALGLDVFTIPESSLKKTKPLTKRVRITDPKLMKACVLATIKWYTFNKI